MNNLFIITYRRPALPLEKTTMNIETAYDCESLPNEELAQIRLKDAQNKYEDVEMFECADYEYLEFVKNDSAYFHFVRTGEHSMKPVEGMDEGYKPPFALWVLDGDDNKWKMYKGMDSDSDFNKDEFLKSANKQEYPRATYINNYIDAKIVPNGESVEESIDADVSVHPQQLCLLLTMNREFEENNFEYEVSIDSVGQIVITPKDTSVSFTDVDKNVDCSVKKDEITNNTRVFTLVIDTTMLSEEGHTSWFYDIDNVGQVVITPVDAETSFLTASVSDSLNLITETFEEATTEDGEYELLKALGLEIIKDIEDLNSRLTSKKDALVRICSRMGVTVNPDEVNIEDLKTTITSVKKNVTESVLSVSEDEKSRIIDRFLNGEITVVQTSVSPEKDRDVIRLAELNDGEKIEFFYDIEGDVIICLNF